MRNMFCGWYFKCRAKNHTLAVIPAVQRYRGKKACSLSVISGKEHWNLILPPEGAQMEWGRPRAVLGENMFRENGIRLSVHTRSLTVEGTLHFGPPTRLRYDIMGPFRFVPFLECRHRVFSMAHPVDGVMTVNGREYDFSGGEGYIEGDRGNSFPKRYGWTQCNFPGGSLMLSVAEIPFGLFRFTGVIGVVMINGKEYRLATYLGARAVRIAEGELMVEQGGLQLEAKLLEPPSCGLLAPEHGEMTRIIRENAACRARYRFYKDGKALLDFETGGASFEFEYP